MLKNQQSLEIAWQRPISTVSMKDLRMYARKEDVKLI